MVSTPARPNALILAAIGLAAGLLSGLFGVGGGIIMVPAMVLLAGMAQQRASATSLASVVPIAAVGAVIFGQADNVNLPAAGVLMVGSIIGVQVGASLMTRVGDDRLRIGFAIFMIAIALMMLVS
ncbi:MAG: sulfite exporter TauE/SafE family protein [Chloroflexota bacterium]|nr:sulfite exporter TauE/SafE family protein [Chloroflexota bacterium]